MFYASLKNVIFSAGIQDTRLIFMVNILRTNEPDFQMLAQSIEKA